MTKVLFNFDFPEDYVRKLAEKYPDLRFVRCPDGAEALSHLAETEILVTFFQFNRRILDAAPRLKWVQALSAGVDYMPLEAIFKRGIRLTNGRGIHRIHMAEYAIAAMVCLARNFHRMFRNQVNRKWDRTPPQDEIYGATAGILGLGEIGREIAKKASVFGMRVIGVKQRPEPVDFVEKVYGPGEMEAVFEQSDYVINLLPLTPATEKLVDRRFFDRMKADACFINIGRGRTVNEPDLVDALDAGRIRAMVSDVFYQEPLPEESPLWSMENVILTPHICGQSPRYMQRAMEIIDHNLNVYVTGKGEMINVVDPSTGY